MNLIFTDQTADIGIPSGGHVAGHALCNNAKSASLDHLPRWIERFADTQASHRIDAVKVSTGWPRRPDRVLSTARATYLWLPAGTRVWREKSLCDPLDRIEVRVLFNTVA